MQATTDIPRRKNNHLLLGDLHDFQQRPLSLMLELVQNHGPLVQLRYANVPQYVINHPDGARYVLQRNNRNYIKDQNFMALTREVLLSGDNLFTSDGDPWLKRRRLMQPWSISSRKRCWIPGASRLERARIPSFDSRRSSLSIRGL